MRRSLVPRSDGLQASGLAIGLAPRRGDVAQPPRLRAPIAASPLRAGSAAAPDAPAAPPSAPPAAPSPDIPKLATLPHFAALPLNRAAHLREQPAALEQLLYAPGSMLIAFHSGKAIVAPATALDGGALAAGHLPQGRTFAAPVEEVPDGGPPRWVLAAWHPADAALEGAVNEDPGFLFLGTCCRGDAAVFACELRQLPADVGAACEPDGSHSGGGDEAGPVQGCWPPRLALVDVRKEGQNLAAGDAAVLALASGLLSWNRNAMFCGRTGARALPAAGGHARRPSSRDAEARPSASASAGAEDARGSARAGGRAAVAGDTSCTSGTSARRPRAIYPRIDPAVIVCVTCGDWLLLGRKASWAAGRYSLLAGFAEVGESLEAAAAREVEEESGVAIDPSTAVYHSSQPWPFPQSLMIAFLAEAPPPPADGNGGGGGRSGGPTLATSLLWGGGAPTAPEPRGLDLLSPAGRKAALEAGLSGEEADGWLRPSPQPVRVNAAELEDARWFHRDWLAAALRPANRCAESADGGRGAAAASAGRDEPAFSIPGRSTLANTVITDWLAGRARSGGAPGSNEAQRGHRPAGGGAPGSNEAAAWSGDALPAVAIDVGTFKYVLIRVIGDGGRSRLLVRGDRRAAYHNDVLQAARREAAAVGGRLRLETVGGGRMEHSAERRAVNVYGYSAAFGQAPHEVTAVLLRRWLPLRDVAVSYEGY